MSSIQIALMLDGKQIKDKDVRNYLRGYLAIQIFMDEINKKHFSGNLYNLEIELAFFINKIRRKAMKYFPQKDLDHIAYEYAAEIYRGHQRFFPNIKITRQRIMFALLYKNES